MGILYFSVGCDVFANDRLFRLQKNKEIKEEVKSGVAYRVKGWIRE